MDIIFVINGRFMSVNNLPIFSYIENADCMKMGLFLNTNGVELLKSLNLHRLSQHVHNCVSLCSVLTDLNRLLIYPITYGGGS
jgi:hypothetical protein